jgi:hypothetical protein
VRWFEIDVSGLPIGPIFKDEVQEESGKKLLLGQFKPIGGFETLVSNRLAPRNKPEDGRIWSTA